MSRDIPNWIIIDANTQETMCKRCGESEKLPKFPIVSEAFIKWSKYFGEKHKYCKPQEKL